VAELTPEQWGFVYQLIVLGIGAGITLILVPHFTNKYQKKQVEIDRKREDRRQQIAIQHELIEKVGHVLTKGNIILGGVSADCKKKDFKFPENFTHDFMIELMPLDATLRLYYGDPSKIFDFWDEIARKQVWAFNEYENLLGGNFDEVYQNKSLTELMKNIKTKMSFDEALEILKKDGPYLLYKKLGMNYYNLLKMIENTPPKI